MGFNNITAVDIFFTFLTHPPKVSEDTCGLLIKELEKKKRWKRKLVGNITLELNRAPVILILSDERGELVMNTLERLMSEPSVGEEDTSAWIIPFLCEKKSD